MKSMPVLVAVLATLALAGTVSKLANHGGMPVTREQVAQEVSAAILGAGDAQLVRKDCKEFDGEFAIDGSQCFLSKLDAEELLPIVQASLQRVGETPGWTQDYGVWGAFYSAKSDPGRSFGVSISGIKENRDLVDNKAASGFSSLVSMVVNSQRRTSER